MTTKTQEAYARGFRKVAEAHGVDPQELYKFAQGGGLLSRGIDLLTRGARAVPGLGKRYIELLAGGNASNLVKAQKTLGGLGAKTSGKAFQSALANNPELKKVMAARLGTLGGLAGIGTVVGERKAYNRGREGKKMHWWNY